MARNTWNRCACGMKLHRKKGHFVCVPCQKKARKKEIKSG